jgi:DUF1680 family protein
VYCIEEADNGENLSALSIDTHSELTMETDETLPVSAVVIKGKAIRTLEESWDNALYRPYSITEKEVEIKAVPYFLWGNREQGEMLVWMNKR